MTEHFYSGWSVFLMTVAPSTGNKGSLIPSVQSIWNMCKSYDMGSESIIQQPI